MRRAPLSGRCTGSACGRLRKGIEDWKPHFELAAQSATLASRSDRPSVKLNEPPYQRQADTEAASGPLVIVTHLRKHLEYAIELVGRHADTAVFT